MSTVHLSGKIDFEAAPIVRQRLLAVVEHGDDLYIELSAVTRIDNAGLSVLVEIIQVGRQIGCSVHLAGVSEDVKHMTRFADLDREFAIHDDRAQPYLMGGITPWAAMKTPDLPGQ